MTASKHRQKQDTAGDMKWFMSYARRTSGGDLEFGCMLLLPDEHPITAIVHFNQDSEKDRKSDPEEPEARYVLLFYREIGPEEQACLIGLDEIAANFSTELLHVR